MRPPRAWPSARLGAQLGNPIPTSRLGRLLLTATVAVFSATPARSDPLPREERTQFVLLSLDSTPTIDRTIHCDTYARLYRSLNAPVREGEAPRSFTMFLVPSILQFHPDAEDLSAEEEPFRGTLPRVGPAYGYAANLEELHAYAQRIRDLAEMGIEMACHTVRHEHGREWSADQWRTEINDFVRILSLSGIAPVVGFRAPFLETTDVRFPVLEEFGFRYDSSRPGGRCWPTRPAGSRIWTFPIPSVEIPGGREVLFFDVNMRTLLREAAEKAGVTGTDEVKTWVEEEYYRAARREFDRRYDGARAPFLISGHGGFRIPTLRLMREACRLPLVRCAAFTEATDYMDAHPEMNGVCH
jgi:peptidoglycan/xylan/chitin deacetylase (PgdA/CDA1 family)